MAYQVPWEGSDWESMSEEEQGELALRCCCPCCSGLRRSGLPRNRRPNYWAQSLVFSRVSLRLVSSSSSRCPLLKLLITVMSRTMLVHFNLEHVLTSMICNSTLGFRLDHSELQRYLPANCRLLVGHTRSGC